MRKNNENKKQEEWIREIVKDEVSKQLKLFQYESKPLFEDRPSVLGANFVSRMLMMGEPFEGLGRGDPYMEHRYGREDMVCKL